MDLTAEQIRAAADITVQPVDAPEWGGRLYAKVMTALELDEFQASRADSPSAIVGIRAWLMIYAACDAGGKRLFAKSDFDWLAAKAGTVADRFFDVAWPLNRLGKQQLEDDAKNSSGEAPAASLTA